MGLDVSVGDLVQLAQDDPELLEDIADDFARLSRALASVGHGEFSEPRQLPDEALFSSRVGSYGTLHYLRRIAAHLWKEDRLPRPGGHEASDSVLDECYAYLEGGGRDTGFDHLIYHSDCEGYYVPIDFPQVVVPPPQLDIPGRLIGSSNALLRECVILAGHLELPLDLDPESDEVWDAAKEQGRSQIKWRHYGIESRVCLVLHKAATLSVKYGSAVCFG